MSTEPKDIIWDKSLPMGKYLAILAKTYLGGLSKKLEHLELERHYSILLLLEDEEGHSSQQFLSDALRIDKASMVRIIDYLVEKDFIERVANPADRREHKLQLTKKGRQALPEIHKAIQEMNEAATTGFSEKEKQDFYRYMRAIVVNLESVPLNNDIIKYKKAN